MALFNIPIVGEDLVDTSSANGLVDDPDDADLQGQFLEFDFSTVRGGGKATVNSGTYVDNDEGEFNAQIELFGPMIPDQFIALTPVGDNGVNTIAGIGVDGVRLMRVILNGSGAVASILIDEKVVRPCWVTLVGSAMPASHPVPSNAHLAVTSDRRRTEVNFHAGPFDGFKFHTKDIQALQCLDMGSTGPQQPGGKKGLEVDTLEFDCTGRLKNAPGFTCSGFFKDAGEPAGKNGNDKDEIHVEIFDAGGGLAAECTGELDGGNIQIYPAVGQP